MSCVMDKNIIISLYLNIPLLPHSSIPESKKKFLQDNYSKHIARYIRYDFFVHHTNNFIDILINYYAETFGKDSLNNILYDLYKDCGYVFDNKYENKDKIDNVIATILSYNPIIEYRIFIFSCYNGHYDLIKQSFDTGTKIKYGKIHPLMKVINSNTSNDNIIRIIDLFLDNGLDIIDFVNSEYFFMTCKLDVIKYIISKSNNYKYHYLHDICACIKDINLSKYNERDFTTMVDYFVQKTLEDYGSIDVLGCYKITALRTIYSNYIMTQYKHQFQYVISKLILYGADIALLNDKAYVPLYQYDEKDELIVLNFYDYVNNIMVKRSDAIEYVRSVSEYMLPDIANVVFDHAYNFNPSEHYDMAVSL